MFCSNSSSISKLLDSTKIDLHLSNIVGKKSSRSTLLLWTTVNSNWIDPSGSRLCFVLDQRFPNVNNRFKVSICYYNWNMSVVLLVVHLMLCLTLALMPSAVLSIPIDAHHQSVDQSSHSLYPHPQPAPSHHIAPSTSYDIPSLIAAKSSLSSSPLSSSSSASSPSNSQSSSIVSKLAQSTSSLPSKSSSNSYYDHDHHHQSPIVNWNRNKRSGISDQRLAELEELLRIEMIRAAMRNNHPVAYGLFDPMKIGRRRRKRHLSATKENKQNLNSIQRYPFDTNIGNYPYPSVSLGQSDEDISNKITETHRTENSNKFPSAILVEDSDYDEEYMNRLVGALLRTQAKEERKQKAKRNRLQMKRRLLSGSYQTKPKRLLQSILANRGGDNEDNGQWWSEENSPNHTNPSHQSKTVSLTKSTQQHN